MKLAYWQNLSEITETKRKLEIEKKKQIQNQDLQRSLKPNQINERDEIMDGVSDSSQNDLRGSSNISRNTNRFQGRVYASEQINSPQKDDDGYQQPLKRWGHTSVEALDRMFIIGGYDGQYLGDIWMYDFRKLQFQQIEIQQQKLIWEDSADLDETTKQTLRLVQQIQHEDLQQQTEYLKRQLKRSNHTSVFYKPHNSIYIFGGGHSHKRRFDNTLKLELILQNTKRDIDSIFLLSDMVDVVAVNISELQFKGAIPSARTYHASTLVEQFMVVIGGESNSADLNDCWALDLESFLWIKPEIRGQNYFTPKRFHSANTIMKTKVITFGGCHSEYVHLNELVIFDLTNFCQTYQSNKRQQFNNSILAQDYQNSQEFNQRECFIECIRVEQASGQIPSSRWGHGAAVMDDDKLFILGGRNEQDISDIHFYDIKSNIWQQLRLGSRSPTPRRRFTSIFLSKCLVMFGGFDGEFFNDLNILDLEYLSNERLQIAKNEKSTWSSDFSSLVNSSLYSDLKLSVNPKYSNFQESPSQNKEMEQKVNEQQNQFSVYLNKALFLHRISLGEIQGRVLNHTQQQLNFLNQKTDLPRHLIKVKNVFKNSQLQENRSVVNLLPEIAKSNNLQNDLKEMKQEKVCENLSITLESNIDSLKLKQALIRLAEFLYTGEFIKPLTITEISHMSSLAEGFGIYSVAFELKKIMTQQASKLKGQLQKEMQMLSHHDLLTSGDSERSESSESQDESKHLLISQQRLQRLERIFERELNKKFQIVCDTYQFDLTTSPDSGVSLLCQIDQQENILLRRNTSIYKDLVIEDHRISQFVLSPEEELLQNRQLSLLNKMRTCLRLDDYFDIIFKISENNSQDSLLNLASIAHQICAQNKQISSQNKISYVKGNSAILMKRSQYFRALLQFDPSCKQSFLQQTTLQNDEDEMIIDEKINLKSDNQNNGVRIIEIQGVPKVFFNCIMQYLYSDYFYLPQTTESLAFYCLLQIYADFFMIDRVKAKIALYVRELISPQNVLKLFLIAYWHNCEEMQLFCIKYLAANLNTSFSSAYAFSQIEALGGEHAVQTLRGELKNYIQNQFVQQSINKQVRYFTITDSFLKQLQLNKQKVLGQKINSSQSSQQSDQSSSLQNSQPPQQISQLKLKRQKDDNPFDSIKAVSKSQLKQSTKENDKFSDIENDQNFQNCKQITSLAAEKSNKQDQFHQTLSSLQNCNQICQQTCPKEENSQDHRKKDMRRQTKYDFDWLFEHLRQIHFMPDDNRRAFMDITQRQFNTQ